MALLAAMRPAGAATNPTADRIKALERQAEESRARAAELGQRTAEIQKDLLGQRQSLTDHAAQVRAEEEALSRLEGEQRSLSEQVAEAAARLQGERARLARLTAGMARLARTPPESLLALSAAPIDAARARMLLASAVTATDEEASRAGRELARLDDLRGQTEDKRREAERAADILKARQGELALLVEQRQSLYQETEADRKTEAERADKIAGEARDLRDLMARIEAEQQDEARRKAHSRTIAPPPRGHFVAGGGLPVAGEIKIRFGQNDGLGTTSHGITLLARPGATVTAPAAGVVRFAGPFRSYREILIIEHPGGYHSLIAGMTRISAALGASVGAGEPVGTMDERPDAKPELYFELRRNGQPVDPNAAALPVDVKGKVR